MSERRERAERLAHKYWRKEFSPVPGVIELVIDLMEGFAHSEVMDEWCKQHNIEPEPRDKCRKNGMN